MDCFNNEEMLKKSWEPLSTNDRCQNPNNLPACEETLKSIFRRANEDKLDSITLHEKNLLTLPFNITYSSQNDPTEYLDYLFRNFNVLSNLSR